jgi:hypothetical protein
MKKFLLGIFCLTATIIYAQDSITWLPRPHFTSSLVLGTCEPLGNFRSSKDSKYPYSYAAASPHTMSYQLTGTWYLYKNTGISFGFGNNVFKLDTANISKTYAALYPGTIAEHYSRSKYNMVVFSTGFSMYWHSDNFYIEPRVMLGIGGMGSGLFDVYLMDKQHNPVKVIRYDAPTSFNMYIRPSVSGIYLVKLTRGLKTGIQGTVEYSFIKSSFSYNLVTTDITTHNTTSSVIKPRPTLGSLGIYGGLILWIDFSEVIRSKKIKFY